MLLLLLLACFGRVPQYSPIEDEDCLEYTPHEEWVFTMEEGEIKSELDYSMVCTLWYVQYKECSLDN